MRHVIGLSLVVLPSGCGSSSTAGDDAGRDAPSAEGAAGDGIDRCRTWFDALP